MLDYYLFTLSIIIGCTDIDECAESIHRCTETCTNTRGSYNCSCRTGYRLANDNQGCNGKQTLLFGFLMPSKFMKNYELQILMNVEKVLMAAIISASTPLVLIAVAAMQAFDLHLIDSLAMVCIKIN